MGQIVAILKGIFAIRSLVETFISAWVKYDIENIRRDYEQKTKEQIEILQAIDKAKKDRNDEAVKHLMRQYHSLDGL